MIITALSLMLNYHYSIVFDVTENKQDVAHSHGLLQMGVYCYEHIAFNY